MSERYNWEMRRLALVLMTLLLSLGGCAFGVPWPARSSKFDGQVGEAESSVPLRVGSATREDLDRRFIVGTTSPRDPSVRCWEDRTPIGAMVYLLNPHNGSPIDVGEGWHTRIHLLMARFDREDRLRAFRLVTNEGNYESEASFLDAELEDFEHATEPVLRP